MEAAAGVIGVLQKAAGAAAATLMGFPNALLQTLMGNSQVQGMVQAATAVSDYASKGIAGIQEAIIGGEYDTFQGAAVAGTTVAAIGAATIAGAIPAAASTGAQMLAGLGSTVANGVSNNAAAGSGLVNFPQGGGTGPTSSSSSSLVTALSGTSTGSSSTGSSALTGAAMDSTGTATGYYNSFKKPGDNSWNFGTKTDHGTTHRGIDYFMPVGTSVKAIADGVVQDVENKHPQNDFGLSGSGVGPPNVDKRKAFSYGNYVKIYHPGGYVSLYAHLSEVAGWVKPGASVAKGQEIGKSGMSGGAYGAHLHLEVSKANSFSDKSGSSTVDPSSLSVSQLVGGGSLGQTAGSSAAPASSGSSASAASIMGNVLDNLKPTGAAASAISNLTKLSSGNSSDIMSAIQSMSSGVGLSLSASASPAALSASTGAATAATLVGQSSKSTGNTFNFNISVPSVTETEAMKFAKLVQQYLDDNTLKTNTVRI
jgi:murein DD-endopeptidase MepM/ murein hydrolase activator NlpD